MITIEGFKIIGISVETTNQDGKSAQDIGQLWARFYNEQLIEKISNKMGDEIYSIYTDYQSDYKGRYKVIIGLKVNSLREVPEGLVGREFKTENFTKFIAKGEMPTAIVNTWTEIWLKDRELNRTYSYDFEVYSHKSQKGPNSEVEIYVATKR